ncbi:3-ketodihydrosphingosine reductase tsc-10 [Microdochium trichocladiopsis]|uniref:3-dehydrosphinganine reductase n=1 Tax=Microdochium trichocladiopsis TaxID=1682393 RepID=A0A9P8YIT9_9PEZI|nr:3-ketodihydrosphingosine reductase tsc-10 [Microdochium trichocladiopsis]KAH7041286.1 3-ketodihydrosphingosine reductase tsc-10 [Microdochium trichocladiopsis]
MGIFSSSNQLPVDGKTVLITGASEGLGRSAAIQFSAKGANVIIVSRSVGKLEQAIADIKAAARNPQTQRFHFISADVSKPDYAQPLLEQAVKWNNGKAIDIVWCTAGMSTPGFWAESPMSVKRAEMDVNFWGSAELAHATLRQWCAPDAPVLPEPKHFIFTASVVAFFPTLGYGNYTPTKAAMRGLADTLVQEVEAYPQNVKVHIVYPGTILSPGFEREELTKPKITQMIEDGDPRLTPEEVATRAIAGLEKGHYSVTVGFFPGAFLRWGAQGGQPRNNWVVDTIMGAIVPFIWIFALPDIFGKIRKFARDNGHPASYTKTA